MLTAWRSRLVGLGGPGSILVTASSSSYNNLLLINTSILSDKFLARNVLGLHANLLAVREVPPLIGCIVILHAGGWAKTDHLIRRGPRKIRQNPTISVNDSKVAMNITLTVPEGSTTHGTPYLLCKPPEWYDYIVFFFANYVAHAATIVSLAGQSFWETFLTAIAALLVPSSGIMRASDIFFQHPIFRKRDPLRQAASAAALCMVVRVKLEGSDSVPVIDMTQFSWMGDIELIRDRAKVHGQTCLPQGYAFAYVPVDAPLSCSSPPGRDGHETNEIASSYNFPKAVISLVQAVWAIVTLYQSRGNQLDRYGYAAFGLTVTPYAYMSLINLAATCLAPEYPNLYMVRTSLMAEAEQNGGFFKGDIATLDLESITTPKTSSDSAAGTWLGLLLGLVPLIIVGALTGFKAGESSPLQRGFIMAWFVVGVVGGIWGWALAGTVWRDPWAGLYTLIALLPVAAPAIGGFVVVGRMLGSGSPKDYNIFTDTVPSPSGNLKRLPTLALLRAPYKDQQRSSNSTYLRYRAFRLNKRLR
ncbi:hypothetical protein BJY00DRAFT_312098 [Aspergillus carlsbadensis]|nr:hypothetical protein BJY00DRAFT_312098 [Aspergillus carlsbadensis]